MVDGLIWVQAAVSSNLTTQTTRAKDSRLISEEAIITDASPVKGMVQVYTKWSGLNLRQLKQYIKIIVNDILERQKSARLYAELLK